MTREGLQTDVDGVVRFRGFTGDYSLRYPLKGGDAVGASFAVSPTTSMPVTLIAHLA